MTEKGGPKRANRSRERSVGNRAFGLIPKEER
jgi:hypothetical protein